MQHVARSSVDAASLFTASNNISYLLLFAVLLCYAMNDRQQPWTATSQTKERQSLGWWSALTNHTTPFLSVKPSQLSKVQLELHHTLSSGVEIKFWFCWQTFHCNLKVGLTRVALCLETGLSPVIRCLFGDSSYWLIIGQPHIPMMKPLKNYQM